MYSAHAGHGLDSVNFLVVGFDVCVGFAAGGFGVGKGAGVGSGCDTHPEKPIVAMAPASARDLRNLRLPIFIVNNR